jgi:hypothetical protein
MPQPVPFSYCDHTPDLRKCRRCGFIMTLEMSEPSNKPHHELRTFVCSGCKTSETIEVAITGSNHAPGRPPPRGFKGFLGLLT